MFIRLKITRINGRIFKQFFLYIISSKAKSCLYKTHNHFDFAVKGKGIRAGAEIVGEGCSQPVSDWLQLSIKFVITG